MPVLKAHLMIVPSPSSVVSATLKAEGQLPCRARVLARGAEGANQGDTLGKRRINKAWALQYSETRGIRL